MFLNRSINNTTSKEKNFNLQYEVIFAEKKIKSLFYESVEEALVPKIWTYKKNRYAPVNVHAWTSLVSILRTVGGRFMSKISFYVILAIIIFLTAISIILAVVSSYKNFSPENKSDTTLSTMSPLFFQCIVLSIFIFLVLILSAISASKVNLKYDQQRHIVRCNILNYQDRLTKKIDKMEDISNVLHALEVCDSSIELHSELDPYCFISIPATPSLVTTLVSVMATILSTSVGLYFKQLQVKNEEMAKI